ncbi:MAG TPA: hypothetical protein VL485_29025 [Ktedonobacteraceae bacterium]|nr:hypothetical protein [Ktedonobacteraceae bacterium]
MALRQASSSRRMWLSSGTVEWNGTVPGNSPDPFRSAGIARARMAAFVSYLETRATRGARMFLSFATIASGARGIGRVPRHSSAIAPPCLY